MNYDWNDLAFASKKPLNELNATFIAAPRQLSPARFKQLVKTYLPQGNLILGLAKEPYVLGLEGQPWFQMLKLEDVQAIIDQINQSSNPAKIATLAYFQRDLPFILEKLKLLQVVIINGSMHHSFHLRPEYYALTRRHIPYEHVTPFAGEQVAKAYAAGLPAPPQPNTKLLTESEMLEAANQVATFSLDTAGQTGVAIGRKQGAKYRPLLTAFNRVVPYQTYAMHHGLSRETNFSPANDLNYYDTNHAEIEAVIAAGRQNIDLAGATVFINVLPCPTCARMFSGTAIAELVYREDHSAGYAITVLEAAGKSVRRLV